MSAIEPANLPAGLSYLPALLTAVSFGHGGLPQPMSLILLAAHGIAAVVLVVRLLRWLSRSPARPPRPRPDPRYRPAGVSYRPG